jgi:hypothetical protein
VLPPEGDDDRFLLNRENRRLRLLRPGSLVGDGGALAPLGDRLRVDPVALRQHPQALLTMLYRSTDCLCRGGAPVENLAHSASLAAGHDNAPSKPGIKHLVHFVRKDDDRSASRVASLRLLSGERPPPSSPERKRGPSGPLLSLPLRSIQAAQRSSDNHFVGVSYSQLVSHGVATNSTTMSLKS